MDGRLRSYAQRPEAHRAAAGSPRCIGALLYPWSYDDVDVPEEDRLRFERVADAMRAFMGERMLSGRPGEVLGYNPEGSSKDYYYSRYGTLAFTFEGRRRVEDRYSDQHVAWWDWICRELSGGA